MIALALLTLHPLDCRAQDAADRERILEVASRIEAAYGKLQSYACDIEGIYYEAGREFERYVFRFYFRKPDRFRIEFRNPYPGVTIFYTEGEQEFTSRPLAAFPSVQFRFSVNNPFFKSPSGQAVNQMHLRHFLGFLRDNARTPAPGKRRLQIRRGDPVLLAQCKGLRRGEVDGTIPHLYRQQALAPRPFRAVRYGRHPLGIHDFQQLQD